MENKSKKALFAALTLFISLAFVLFCFEIAVRAIWRTSPEIEPIQTPIYSPDPDPDILFTLTTNASGFNNFTLFRHNSLGYRGPEISSRKKPGVFRVIVAGDSFVYGTALREKDSLPAQLERELKKDGIRAEVINAGVPGYNIGQNMASVRKAANLEPDVIALSFIYNDLENITDGIERAMPLMKASPLAVKQTGGAPGAVSEFLLPVNGSGRPTLSARFRCFLARRLRSYLYAAISLRRAGCHYDHSSREFTFPQTSSAQSEALVWRRVENALNEFGELGRTRGFKPLFIIYFDYYIEGRPALRLAQIAKKAGVDVLDLSPNWGGMREYGRRWSLGWDPHPNAAADALAARSAADFMSVQGWTPMPPAPERKKRFEKYLLSAKQHEREQAAIAKTQLMREEKLRREFGTRLAPGSGAIEDQWLYGWWPEGDFAWDSGGGRWMSGNGGCFLKVPRNGARHIILEGYRVESEQPSPRQLLFISSPQLQSEIAMPVPNGHFLFKIALGNNLKPGSAAEFDFSVSRLVSPAALGVNNSDNRMISLAFTQIALK
ncbi:MAG: hypothetical protein WCX65_11720 [bacterium]